MGATARYTKMLTFALSPPMYDRVHEVAAEREVSIGAVLRESLRAGLAKPIETPDMASASAGDD